MDAGGFERALPLDKAERLTTYTPAAMRVSTGTRLIFTKGNQRAGIQNGQTFTVKGIEEDRLLLADAKGNDRYLDTRRAVHARLGRAVTVQAGQGWKWPAALPFLPARSMGHLDQEKAKVLFSRAKQMMRVHTDSVEVLKEKAATLEIPLRAHDVAAGLTPEPITQ